MREELTIHEIYPLIEETIRNGGTFRFYPRGTSMRPMLVQGEDSIALGKAEDIRVGDVLFYRRESGQFVLHRLIDKRGEMLTLCGDNQWALEYGIRQEQVLAKLVGYYKGETYHTVDEPEYLAYQESMVRRFPFYWRNPILFRLSRKIKRLIKK